MDTLEPFTWVWYSFTRIYLISDLLRFIMTINFELDVVANFSFWIYIGVVTINDTKAVGDDFILTKSNWHLFFLKLPTPRHLSWLSIMGCFKLQNLSKISVSTLFYLNTIEHLFHFVEQLDQLEVCLPYSRLLTGIPMLLVFQNLR